MDKIAICGKMASGKTYLAQKMTDERGFQRFSLAGAVKQLGTDYFGMVKKDRPLLQKIGMKMREIRPNVWIDYVVRDIGVHEQECQAVFGTTKGMGVVVDDVRFLNEAKAFKEAGFTLVRLHIEDDLQIEGCEILTEMMPTFISLTDTIPRKRKWMKWMIHFLM